MNDRSQPTTTMTGDAATGHRDRARLLRTEPQPGDDFRHFRGQSSSGCGLWCAGGRLLARLGESGQGVQLHRGLPLDREPGGEAAEAAQRR